ncbi:ABC transporter permease [Veillonella magna]|uniref:ABC transporter permease n=1 Tax=Veillonella magna TaxID=464322 RepID=UPI000425ED9B|nr:ABC transporter permease [Veillonella magna]
MSFRRLRALIYKECLQLTRDPSSFFIGLVIPALLIFLIGFGMSMDVTHIPTAVVLEDSSPTARSVVSFMNESPYFSPRYVTSMQEAKELMDERRAEAILRIPGDFSARLSEGRGKVQLITYGVDTTIANATTTYVQNGIARWQQSYLSGTAINGAPAIAGASSSATLSATPPIVPGSVTVDSRQWFNDANTSTWMFIPGLIVIVMTLVGVFLTALVMAREWERGTLESLFVTPMHASEIVFAKIIPYFGVAMIGFFICLLSARYVYEVPIEGSIFLILFASVEYVLVAIGMGLTISSVLKNQFLSCQLALLVSLLPTIMLSGFIFDLRSVPTAVNVISHLMPATYYMDLLKSLFLAGNNPVIIYKNCAILAGYASLFIGLSLLVTRKRLD